MPEVGVPRIGLTNVGVFDRTLFPEPVEVVTPVPPLPTAKVADSPAAVPDVFWFSVGNVQLVKFPDAGVPRIGVTNVGLFDRTLFPEPVDVVTPVPPLATVKAFDKVRLFAVTLAVTIPPEAVKTSVVVLYVSPESS